MTAGTGRGYCPPRVRTTLGMPTRHEIQTSLYKHPLSRLGSSRSCRQIPLACTRWIHMRQKSCISTTALSAAPISDAVNPSWSPRQGAW